MIAHVAEHIDLLYRTRMESAIGMPMPELPDFKILNLNLMSVDPRTDAMISQRAAQVVQQAPIVKDKRTSRATTEILYSMHSNLHNLKQMHLKQELAAQIQTDQAKAAQDIQIKDAQARQKLCYRPSQDTTRP